MKISTVTTSGTIIFEGSANCNHPRVTSNLNIQYETTEVVVPASAEEQD
jgi:hypothetical protein